MATIQELTEAGIKYADVSWGPPHCGSPSDESWFEDSLTGERIRISKRLEDILMSEILAAIEWRRKSSVMDLIESRIEGSLIPAEMIHAVDLNKEYITHTVSVTVKNPFFERPIKKNI